MLSPGRVAPVLVLLVVAACEGIVQPKAHELEPPVLTTTTLPAANGVFAYVTTRASNSVSVIETATNTVTATVPVGSKPQALAITPDGALAYVADTGSHSVSVIATATNTVVATIPVGRSPLGVAITPDGAFAYVANFDSNSVSVIDTATNTVVATIPVARSPKGVAITPDGAFAYFVNSFSNLVSVIATATNAVVATVPVGTNPQDVAITPNGAFVYVQTGRVIATATNTVVATFPVGGAPSDVAITPDGALAYVSNFGSNSVSVIATATNTVVATIPVGLPDALAITRLRAVTPVEIDIKPGSDPNSINCTNERGVITVAILATPDFDATTVDHTTVTFEGATETHVDKRTGQSRRHEEDIDGDGDTDLVFHFGYGESELTCASTEGTLSGETFGGELVEGTDAARMIGGSRLSFSFADPTGDHLQLNPVRQLNPPVGVIDVVGLHFTFDNTTGDYEIILTASATNPFTGGFRVNVLLFNADTGTTSQDPAYFVDSGNDFFLTAPSTAVTLTGVDPKLAAWGPGDRVAACQGSSFGEFGPCLGGLGLPDGVAGFGTGVFTFTTPPPFGSAKGLDVFFTAPAATIGH